MCNTTLKWSLTKKEFRNPCSWDGAPFVDPINDRWTEKFYIYDPEAILDAKHSITSLKT